MKYEPTRAGLDKLFSDNQDLAQVARTVVMWYLKKDFGRTEDRMKSALIETSEWMGINQSNNLFTRFKNELDAIGYDENDEHGLADETVKVANLMLNYKDLKSKEKVKKSIFG
jgi:hypothetical protein